MDLFCCQKRYQASRTLARGLTLGPEATDEVVLCVVKADLTDTARFLGYLDLFVAVSWGPEGEGSLRSATTPTHWRSSGSPVWLHECTLLTLSGPPGPWVERQSVSFEVMEQRFGGWGTPCSRGAASCPLAQLLDEGGRPQEPCDSPWLPPQKLELRLCGAAAGTITVAACLRRLPALAALQLGLEPEAGAGKASGEAACCTCEGSRASSSSSSSTSPTESEKLEQQPGAAGGPRRSRPGPARPSSREASPSSSSSAEAEAEATPMQAVASAMMRRWSRSPERKGLADAGGRPQKAASHAQLPQLQNFLTQGPAAPPPMGSDGLGEVFGGHGPSALRAAPHEAGASEQGDGQRAEGSSQRAEGAGQQAEGDRPALAAVRNLAKQLRTTARKYPASGKSWFGSGARERFFAIRGAPGPGAEEARGRNWVDGMALAWYQDEATWRWGRQPLGSVALLKVRGATLGPEEQLQGSGRNVSVSYIDEGDRTSFLVLLFPSSRAAGDWSRALSELAELARRLRA